MNRAAWSLLSGCIACGFERRIFVLPDPWDGLHELQSRLNGLGLADSQRVTGDIAAQTQQTAFRLAGFLGVVFVQGVERKTPVADGARQM